MGRAVIFKSEVIEHEVRPALGYDRYAVTVWFHQKCEVEEGVRTMVEGVEEEVLEDYSIFVGIPSYRDSEIVPTLKSIIEQA